MKKNLSSKRSRRAPKAVLRLPDLDHAKTAVLNSLNCPEAQRGYRYAIDEFVDWYCSQPRLAFNKTVVLRYPRVFNGAAVMASGDLPPLPSHLLAEQYSQIGAAGLINSAFWSACVNPRPFSAKPRITGSFCW